MNGIFVTGTDTGVGKSVTCAWLVRNWKGDYWKPVQSGSRDGSDTDDVRFLARMPGDHFHPPATPPGNLAMAERCPIPRRAHRHRRAPRARSRNKQERRSVS